MRIVSIFGAIALALAAWLLVQDEAPPRPAPADAELARCGSRLGRGGLLQRLFHRRGNGAQGECRDCGRA